MLNLYLFRRELYLLFSLLFIQNTSLVLGIHFFLSSNRQMLDNAVRANRKHMISIQSAVSKIEPDKPQPAAAAAASPQAALEQGNYH